MVGRNRPCFPRAASFGAGKSMWFIIFLLFDVTRWCGVLYRTYDLTLMPRREIKDVVCKCQVLESLTSWKRAEDGQVFGAKSRACPSRRGQPHPTQMPCVIHPSDSQWSTRNKRHFPRQGWEDTYREEGTGDVVACKSLSSAVFPVLSRLERTFWSPVCKELLGLGIFPVCSPHRCCSSAPPAA